MHQFHRLPWVPEIYTASNPPEAARRLGYGRRYNPQKMSAQHWRQMSPFFCERAMFWNIAGKIVEDEKQRYLVAALLAAATLQAHLMPAFTKVLQGEAAPGEVLAQDTRWLSTKRFQILFLRRNYQQKRS